jgi:hypothetical protein
LEESLSTDALEKTLVEEAEARILEIRGNAEAEARRWTEAFDTETEALAAAGRAGTEAQISRVRDDLERSLPLGRRRLEGAFLDREVRRALGAVLGEIDDQTWRQIFDLRLAKALPILGPGTKAVFQGEGGDRMLTATSNDGRTMFQVSVRSLTEELLETRRGELVEALFPGRFGDAGPR